MVDKLWCSQKHRQRGAVLCCRHTRGFTDVTNLIREWNFISILTAFEIEVCWRFKETCCHLATINLRLSSWEQKVPCTLGWHTEGTWLCCGYLIWCILYSGCFNLFCNAWVCVCVGFVMCGCFGNTCTCIYCVLYCVFVLFRLCIFILICFGLY
jgi:hypothetical protein